jgi:hypothetical protein
LPASTRSSKEAETGFAHWAQPVKKVSLKNLEEARMKVLAKVALVAIAIGTVLCAGTAQAVEINWPEPTWPDIFEPNQLLTLNLQMDPCDWHDIINNHPITDPNVGLRGCLPEEIERPAWFWMDGEDANKIVVAVRRKKGDAFPDEVDPCKVALKIDINQYYCADPCSPDCNLARYDPNAAPDWHGQKKLSLEVNIDASDAISEGVAVNLHRMASATEGYGWPVWYGSWCELYVNGAYKGVYAHVEQYDKEYMIHRNIYEAHGHSWLYKHHDCDGRFVLKIGDDTYPRSQAVEALCYDPFYSSVAQTQSSGGQCAVPDDANVIADMNQWVDMSRMLHTAAIDAILANSDPLFWNNNNTYFYDPNIDEPNLADKKRLYFPWDVDASFKDTGTDIYYTGGASGYDQLILAKPVFRSQYNQIIRDLLDGPLSFADVNDFLDMVEPVITTAVEADPWLMSHIYDRIGATSAAQLFDWLRDWFAERIPNVRNQVDWDEPLMPPGTVLLDDDFNNTTWDANWTNSGTWAVDSGVYAHESPSAKAPAKASGTFTCLDLDTSDAETVHVDFWLQKDDTDEAEDIILYYYNGTSYVSACDLDTLGEDDEWLHYTDTITDSNYFVSTFKIRLDAVLENGENVWLDEVVITKETAAAELPLIYGHVLDPCAAPVTGVSVDANNLGGSDTTDVNGYYEIEVPNDWSGTVTPTKTGYSFAPTDRSYSNVTTDQNDQDYTATLLTYTISGAIVDANTDPVVGVSVDADNGGGSDTTDPNGEYSLTVDYDWSGTVTPTKTGYTFAPTDRPYSNVTSDQIDQDYTATLLTYSISGTVTSGGPGLDGVTMDGLPGSPVTAGGGLYNATVPYGWGGTVTPTLAGYTFVPASRLYSNVTSDQLNQDYAGTLLTYTISGTILGPGSGPVPGVSVDADNGGGSDVTDPNGDYSLTVDYDWSGTVTPTKTDYTFAPTDRSYSNVTSDQTAQDYTGTHICDIYPDGIIDLKDVDVVCENWLTAGPSGDIDNSAFVDLTDFTMVADAYKNQ